MLQHRVVLAGKNVQSPISFLPVFDLDIAALASADHGTTHILVVNGKQTVLPEMDGVEI